MSVVDSTDPSLLRSVLEDLPIGVRVGAPGCRWLYTNRVFRDIVGPGSYRILDRALAPYPADQLPAARVVRERTTVTADDLVVERADGSRVDVRAFASPLFDAAGNLTHVVLAFSDVTAEVQAAAEGAVARERLFSAIRHAPIILFGTEANGIITLSEGAAVRALGFEPGELVGRSVFDLYPESSELLVSHQRALRGESLTNTLDLNGVVLESWLGPLRNPAGEVVGTIGVSTDVTERLRLEKQVAQAERLSALGRLASSVAHEINNPLAYTVEALRLATESLAELEATPSAVVGADQLERLRKLLGEASEGAERVRLTMRDLRSFSRGDEDERRPLDLDQIVGTAIKLVAKRTGTRAEIERRRGPPVVVRADENQLVQIFVNLILNAADALPATRAEHNRIRVSTRLDGDMAVVEVADSGPGVPEAVRDAIFEPFFTTKPVGEGTGLGLFVTRKLVTALGGAVTIGDAPEGGALFSVRLPVEHEGVPVAVPASSSRPNAAARFRVLIIDDDPQVSELLRLSLEREFPSAHVRAFTSGEAALQHLLGGERYDLVFCDLMMGELSGMRIHEELRRKAPGRERELVFMTGGVYDAAVSDFLAAVPNDCLDKPFDIRAEVRRRLATSTAGGGATTALG